MRCPFCGSDQTHVLETREAAVGLRRRRQCGGCSRRFTTFERAAPAQLCVLKRDGRREPFDRDKLLRGLVRAAAKRPLEVLELERLCDRVAAELLAAGAELPADRVGELVLRELRALDPVAYVRFASVYRNFSDVEDFAAELARLDGLDGCGGADRATSGTGRGAALSVRSEAEDAALPPDTPDVAAKSVKSAAEREE